MIVKRMYEPPDWIQWDDDTYRGDAYATYGWGCDVAELELDPDTCEVRPLRLTAVQEFGQRDPSRARARADRGRHGAGPRLRAARASRDARRRDGQRAAHQLHHSDDARHAGDRRRDDGESVSGGPFGAKGLGELPMDGPAPAVVNALRHLGLDVREIPATPERSSRTRGDA